MPGVAIPTSIAILAIGSGAAWAQETCPDKALAPAKEPMTGFPGYMDSANVQACATKYGKVYDGVNGTPACFRLDGSDTLTEVIQRSINQSGACISYHNIGSGQAETNMLAAVGTGSGTVNQGIGPMSRNFKSTAANNDSSHGVAIVNPTWVPNDQNVVALDAGIWTFHTQGGDVKNLWSSVWTGPMLTPVDSSCTPFMNAGVSPLAILIAGAPASLTGSPPRSEATTPECAHPCRYWLLNQLGSQSGEGTQIEHILRRDDKSGTQDTFREKLNVDRWCNGKSEGNVNALGSNLLNEDLDPIRKDCMASDTNYAVSRCTYYPTSQSCENVNGNLDGDIPAAVGGVPGTLTIRGTVLTNPYTQPLHCTQGAVVALSENDPTAGGAYDITSSIGLRVAFGAGLPLGSIVGLAGLASEVGVNDVPSIDGITTVPNNIYHGNYMFARRLFVMNNPGFTQANALPAEQAGRPTEEQKLYNWMTVSNVCDVSTIATNPQVGFLSKWIATTCTSSETCVSAGEGTILTCLKADYGVSTPKMNIGDETSNNACDVNYPCVANGLKGTGTPLTCGGVGSTCPVIPVLASGYACNLNQKCSSGVCPTSGTTAGSCN